MKFACLLLVLLLLPVSVFAQSAADCTGAGTGAAVPVSPTPRVQFTASTDHNTVISGTTTPLLTNYAIAVCTASTLVFQASLGKPTPSAQNQITLPIPTPGALSPQVLYYVVLYSVGPGGSSKAPVSNPFVLAGAPAAASRPDVLP